MPDEKSLADDLTADAKERGMVPAGPVDAEPTTTMPTLYDPANVAPTTRREDREPMTPVQFKAALDGEIAKFRMLEDAIREMLIPGQDFGLIHKKYKPPKSDTYRNCSRTNNVERDAEGRLVGCPECGAKHSLWKGGAEKVVQFRHCTADFTYDKDAMALWASTGAKGVLAMVCTIVDRTTGVKVSEGRGSAVLGNNQNDANKTVKMCEKSALIDAVLGFGLSSVFTQDIEAASDYGQKGATEAPEESPEIQELKAELNARWPGIMPEAKNARSCAVDRHFGTRLWAKVKDLPIEKLRAGLAALKAEPNPQATAKEQTHD